MLVTASPLQKKSEHDINIWKISGEVEKVHRRFLMTCLVFFLKSFVMISTVTGTKPTIYTGFCWKQPNIPQTSATHLSTIREIEGWWATVSNFCWDAGVIFGNGQRLESSCFMGGEDAQESTGHLPTSRNKSVNSKMDHSQKMVRKLSILGMDLKIRGFPNIPLSEI